MNRDHIKGHWKQTKGRAHKSAGRWLPSARDPRSRRGRFPDATRPRIGCYKNYGPDRQFPGHQCLGLP
jgi:hypothetical protein